MIRTLAQWCVRALLACPSLCVLGLGVGVGLGLGVGVGLGVSAVKPEEQFWAVYQSMSAPSKGHLAS
jgi:hypothetical protein